MGNYWTICPVVKKGAKVHFIHNSFMLLDFGNLYQKNKKLLTKPMQYVIKITESLVVDRMKLLKK